MDARHHGAVPGLAAPNLAHHDVFDLAPLGTAAAHAVMTPTSEKAPDAANVEGPAQAETQHPVFEQHTHDGKQLATLRAHLALKGCTLHRKAAGDGCASTSPAGTWRASCATWRPWRGFSIKWGGAHA